MKEHGTYRKDLDKRIKAGRVYLNDKQTKVAHYKESGSKAVVHIGKVARVLNEDDTIIIT